MESLEARLVLDSTLVFNEVMYQPADERPDLEWVEFHNQMSVDLDISGWSLRGGVDFDFPEGTIVSGKSYLVVAADPAALASSGGPADAMGPFTGRLSNEGEELRLLNNSGRRMNELDFSDRGRWPAGPDGSGSSLSKIDPMSSGDSPTDWTHSPLAGGTPGAANLGHSTTPWLVINEVEGASADRFFVEIANAGDAPVDLTQVSLAFSGDPANTYAPASGILSPGEVWAIEQEDFGYRPTEGERVFLRDQQQRLVDARRVTGRLRGRVEVDRDPWLYPATPTPGSDNQFELRDDIVINELMYHFRPDPPTEGEPPTYETEVLVPLNGTWRFNDTGAAQPSNWAALSHSRWPSGAGLIGFETSPLPAPISTPLTNPANNTPRIITYYFETEFQFAGDPEEPGLQLLLRHVIDDGAVFYLNGQPLTSYNMPDVPITPDLFAEFAIDNAASIGPLVVAGDALVNGTNRLSVEVHQGSATSSDVVFGVEASIRRQVAPAGGGTPFHESDEEWVELYNRGQQPVDLSGWTLTGGVDYRFDDGVVIPADGYLVIARDAAALRTKYGGRTGVGDFDGILNNDTDRIVLRDPADNPADFVEYFDGGYWPRYADGGGSSLELVDPRADNSRAEAWAASLEADKAGWRDYSFRRTATDDTGPDGLWNEFVFGLLDEGEVLIDDVSVVADPDGSAVQLIQNGGFQNDGIGNNPSRWRIIGNHQGRVVLDPDSSTNRVLHLTSTGPTEHQHNNAQSTLAGNTPVVNGLEYEISFRARWVAGSPQLNSRFYVNRVQVTSILEMPEQNGTPGARNSTYQVNVGPTYRELAHDPPLPNAFQDVTVTLRAGDPDGVESMTLYYAVNQGTWRTVAMTHVADDLYRVTMPGQGFSATVQFYVEGRDALGFTSTYPADGRDSRALIKFNDGQTTGRPVDTVRIVMTGLETSRLYDDSNLMSNQYVGATVILNNDEIYYDVGVRLKGSPFGRAERTLQDSFNLRFRPEQPFRGVHQRISLDGSGRTAWDPDSRDEILVKQLMNHAGDMTSMYDDVAYVIAPSSIHTGPMLVQMARYDNDYLDEAYEDGSEGTVHEFEIIYFSFATTNGHPEAPKIASAPGLIGTDIRDLGSSKEDYRWNFMIKNNRAEDRYDHVMELARAFDLTGNELELATSELMDVDQWMRVFAMFALTGNIDVYNGSLHDHNIFLYRRPEDGKILVLPWDMDFSFSENISAPLYGTDNLRKVIEIPSNLRLFHGHLLDMLDTTYNRSYMTRWANHFATLTGENYSGHTDYIEDRGNFIRSRLPAQEPFVIRTNGGADFSVDEDFVTIQGDGWIDVRQTFLAGSDVPLDVVWTDGNSWRVTLPLNAGANTLAFQARNHRGEPVGSDTITVTSLADTPALVEALRITELNYHPHDPAAGSPFDDDDFEYVELTNVADSAVNLRGVRFTDGIDFTFPDMLLAPGQFVMVAKDPAAFQSRYGDGLLVVGPYGGNLNNGGEALTLSAPGGEPIVDFVFDDEAGWPGRPDGNASSLQVVDTAGDYSDPANWRASLRYGGSPGTEDIDSPVDVVVNEVLSHTDPPVVDSIELFNTSDQDVDVGGWFLSDSNDDYRKFRIPAGTVIAGGGYLVLDERHFNAGGGADPDDFALDGARGDDVWLVASDAAGEPFRFADHAEFGAQANGQSWGRWPNPLGRLYPMTLPTLGAENAGPYLGQAVFSEVMYHAPDPDGPGGIDPADLEYVEIYNSAPATVDLTGWEISGGIDYSFPPATTLPGGGTIVVLPFDPSALSNASRAADFRAVYEVADDVVLVGGYEQVLDNGSDRLRLTRPDQPPADDPDFVPRLLEDEVEYDDTDPWPTEPDGAGPALHRVVAASWGHDPASWQASDPTPGSVSFENAPPRVVSVEINSGIADPPDLNGVPQSTRWSSQRSTINSIVVTFDADMSISVDDLRLINQGVDAPLDPDAPFELTEEHVTVSGQVMTLTFADFELGQGVYKLEVLDTATSVVGVALDGDGDGVGGDPFVHGGDATNGFYALPGDFNGDQGVSIFDFSSFTYWFGTSVGVAPSYFDLNLDLGVSIFDFNVFAGQFGRGIVFPDYLATAAATALIDGSVLPVLEQLDGDVLARAASLDRLASQQLAARRPTSLHEQPTRRDSRDEFFRSEEEGDRTGDARDEVALEEAIRGMLADVAGRWSDISRVNRFIQ